MQFRAGRRRAPRPALGPHDLHFRVRPAANLACPPAVFGNTLCREPARPALLLPAGAAWPGRPAQSAGFGFLDPRYPTRRAATEPPSTCPRFPRARAVQPAPRARAGRPNVGCTARNREIQKDAVAHFKTKPIYCVRRLFVPVQGQIL